MLKILIIFVVGSRIASYTTLRASQMICGGVMPIVLIPVVLFLLPTTHSIPRLATAKLRPQANFESPKMTKFLSSTGLLANGYKESSFT